MRHAYETASQRQDVHCPENEDEDEPQVQMSQVIFILQMIYLPRKTGFLARTPDLV